MNRSAPPLADPNFARIGWGWGFGFLQGELAMRANQVIHHAEMKDPGDFQYYGGFQGMVMCCPGCGVMNALPFHPRPDPPAWNWNGDRINPTLTPSVLHTKEKGGCGWHGYLTNGEWVPC